MNQTRKQRIEFGDFQTPDELAIKVCDRLASLGVNPKVVIEPTCGTGAFVTAALSAFPQSEKIIGFDINPEYLDSLAGLLRGVPGGAKVELHQGDFFNTDWKARLHDLTDPILILGNFPWVTNATQGAIGGTNLPEKTNFLGRSGFDAMTGKSNFDVSEWMLLEVLNWFRGRSGEIAMLVKTGVARKVLAHANRQQDEITDAFIVGIDAKKHFDASVAACLLVLRFGKSAQGGATNGRNYDYTVFESLEDREGVRCGHRMGLSIRDLATFDKYVYLLGESPQRWRSGMKHDASSIMELTRLPNGLYQNGNEDVVELEDTFVFPMFKGSDIATHRAWRNKFVIVTQRYVGEPTIGMSRVAPLTWAYLQRYAAHLNGRSSSIYTKGQPFAVFGIGDYAFRPWKIAVCALYKRLEFRLIGPIEDRPVMFDDTVYYLSFDTEREAEDVLERLRSAAVQQFMSSMVFWDEKRPIKTSVLNLVNWTHTQANVVRMQPSRVRKRRTASR